MRKFNKSLSLLFVLTMIMSIVPFAFSASAEQVQVKEAIFKDDAGILEYRVISESKKTVEVAEFLSTTEENVVIPSTIKGYTVKSIGGEAFYVRDEWVEEKQECVYVSSLKSVTIPDTVTKIIGGAFENCINMTNVNIPSSVKSIGVRAFENCKSLTDITIPSDVQFIGEEAFGNCDKLTSVKILNSSTEIEERAFGYDYVSSERVGDDWIYVYNKTDNLTITAYKGSTAEEYANDNGFKFVEIPKSNTTITAKAVKKTYKAKALKNKAKSFKLNAKANSGGAITFKKTSGNKKITVSKAGKVTVKKGIKKGTYKVKVKISSVATSTFNAGNKVITLKITIKNKNK